MSQNPSIAYDANGNARAFHGREAVEVFRAAAIASVLRLYARTGLKANRAYTPSAMLRVAGEITGRKFKRGQYHEAADALGEFVQREKARIPAERA